MTIYNYTPALKQPLADLMVAYFPEVDADIPEEIIRGKLSDLIDEQHSQGILHVTVATKKETPIGFSIFQIDTPESDWCKRPGWGFIREFYIAKQYRSIGKGRFLAEQAELLFQKKQVEHIYLNTSGALGFWLRCGYTVDAVDDETQMATLIKKLG